MKLTITLKGTALLLLILFAGKAFTQGTIRGTVTDPSGEPLIGANVILAGTSTGTATEVDGSFEIRDLLPGTYTLRASYTGYQEQRKTVGIPAGGGLVAVSFVLAEASALLEQVVVVGYGTQRRRTSIGTIEKIDGGQLDPVVGGTFDNALQGLAAGVQVTQASGIAGAPSFIRIRGAGSISAGGDPLYVIDGMIVNQDIFANGSSFFDQNNNPLSSINPADIESIEILKDAAAAAIYGSRGANGVILITTKRGKKGKPTFTYNSSFGFSRPSKMLEFLSGQEYLFIRQEAWENDGNVGRAPLPPLLEANGYSYDEVKDLNTDWLDMVIHTGFKHEHNLGFRQGGDKLTTYANLAYSKAETYLVGNSFERISGRLNLDYKFTPRLSASLSSSLARGLNDRTRQQFQGGFGAAQSKMLPIYPVRDKQGRYFNFADNPLAQEEFTDLKTREWRSINNLSLVYRPIDGLLLNLTGNYDYQDIGDYNYESTDWIGFFNPTNPFAIAKANTSVSKNYSSYGTAEYELPLNSETHSLKVLGGIEYQRTRVEGKYVEWQGVSGHIYTDPDTTGENFAVLNFTDNIERDFWKFFSIFGRANYGFKDRYLLQFTFRRDGSTRFGRNKRFGNFPAVGLGWIVSEESFLKGNPTLNYLKLKASWGLTGNAASIPWREQFAEYQYPERGTIGVRDGYNGQTIRYEVRPENPDLQWEVKHKYDAGIEFGLLNDRITANFAVYYEKTTDAFLQNSLQASGGVPQQTFWENVAEIENKGFEAQLSTRNLVGAFRWKTDLVFSRNKNKVLDVGTAQPDALAGGFGDVRVIVGESLGSNYLVRWSHVDPATGHPVYLTADGQETFVYDVVNNRVVAGDVYPKIAGGITNTFSYKNFDLSVLFTFQIGGTVYDDGAKRSLGVVTDWQMSRDVLDRWRQPGDVATYPRLTMSMLNWGGNDNFWQNNHTLWLYDATYGRVKNVTLGYTLRPKNIAWCNSIRLYVNGSNLLTFSDFPGWDPEVSRERNNSQERNIAGTGVTFFTAPQERTFNFGLNVEF